MVSKVNRCKDYLDLLPEPNSRDILRVAKKVGCSERTAWEGYSRLKKERDKVSKIYSTMMDLASKMIKMRYIMIRRFRLLSALTYTETKTLDSIDATIESLRLEFDLDEKGFPYEKEG